ncbi:ADP-ribosylglycohydrolase [Thermococcus pacificus]|uniref:ADP-ribosylglycohydrolase n=2 Tax=Thermococcus pacificus TaxID=71998 RepID=A0A218PAC6_9EURY|nr:ADP-ribosylglycohydrolase [Thermococcus pacificus]
MGNEPDLESRLKGGLWGVVVGDAFGFPFQFWSRERMREEYPNPEDIPMLDGLWSDDSSLTLATAHALKDGYSLERIAQNFISWYYDGEFTPRGHAFDEGITTSRAIERLAKGVFPLNAGGRGERDNGNGSLMRILPVAYYAYFKMKNLEERLQMIHEVSMLTHAHPRSLVGCGIYSMVVWNILSGLDKFDAYSEAVELAREVYSMEPFSRELEHYERVLSGKIHKFAESEIRGSGYVVHTLEAALWAFLRNNSFEDAIREVVSLAEDTDTTGAVVGGLAGTYYGFEAIPGEWLGKIEARELIEEIINDFVFSLIEARR